MKFYMITCLRGHCGTGHSGTISFAFSANNLLDACDMARKMPSVKHTRGVLKAVEITEAKYQEYIAISAYERMEQYAAKYTRKNKRR